MNKPASIEAYLEQLSEDRRSTLQTLREMIHSLVPGLEECISYSMPAFRKGKHVVAGFLATKAGCSYYPFSGSTLGTLAADLKSYQQTKSALHFESARPLPRALVKKLLRARLAEFAPSTSAPKKSARPARSSNGSEQAAALKKKLQMKEGATLRAIRAPRGLELGPLTKSGNQDALIVFVRHEASLIKQAQPALDAALSGKSAWIAYPKAGQLGTDLSRDRLWKLLAPEGIHPIRQIALDDVWTALRFRPN